MSKKLSVIIPCYNHGAFLEETIQSVVQSDPERICEIIVINDGSSDSKTLDVLTKLKNEKLTVIDQENLGLAGARNKGIEISSCDYLLILDSDNKIRRDFILKFTDLQSSGVSFDMLHGNAEYFGERKGCWPSAPLNLMRICKTNYIDACSIIKKDSLIELGMYDSQMPYMGWEDWDLWIRMATNKKVTLYFDEVFFDYRYASDSMNRISIDKEGEIRKYFAKKYNLIFDSDQYEKLVKTITEIQLNENLTIKKLFITLLFRLLRKFFKTNGLQINL